jgi:hypothetical protein
MGAPFGNQNAAKAKKWTAAIERALARRAGKAFAEALDDLADKFIAAVENGDKDALPGFKEFGDRIEGRTVQPTEVSGPDGSPINFGWMKPD